MSAPIPVVLCGASAQIATGVKNGLLPEIEGRLTVPPPFSAISLTDGTLHLSVIHVILSAEAGAAEIPLLLEGNSLPASENVGSQNYSRKPVAVVTGGGYDDARFKMMKDACEGKGSVSWLRPDMGYPMPALGPQYSAIMIERVKKGIKELVESGKLGKDGVFIY